MIGILGMGLIVTGIPIPSPHTYAHFNYLQQPDYYLAKPGEGSFRFQYTVIHPPHPQHKFYPAAVPVSYTKPLYIYNPFQHPIFLFDSNLQLQLPAADQVVIPTDPKVPGKEETAESPSTGAISVESADKRAEADESSIKTNIDKDYDEQKDGALSDTTIAVESGDQNQGQDAGDSSIVDAANNGEFKAEIDDEEDLEGGAKAKGPAESLPNVEQEEETKVGDDELPATDLQVPKENGDESLVNSENDEEEASALTSDFNGDGTDDASA